MIKQIIECIFAKMTYRNLHIFMLYLAGIILSGHSFIPHRHELSPESPLHSKYYHLHNAYSNDDETAENNTLSSAFSRLLHHEGAREITYIVVNQGDKRCKINHFSLPEVHLSFRALKKPPPIILLSKETADLFYSSPPAGICFRGPPACV